MARKQIARDQFVAARSFIFTDISRELQLARASQSADGETTLRILGVEPGGGNFLAALAALCYTEFAGGIVTRGDGSRVNFDVFLRRMGPDYGALLDFGLNVYKVFRCGMAHEYFAKGSISVSMFGNPPTGLGRQADGRLFFCLERYFVDFIAAYDKLGVELGFY